MDLDLEQLSLDRIPLPSLKVYSVLSFLAACCSLHCFWVESQNANVPAFYSINDINFDYKLNSNFGNSCATMEHHYQPEEVIFSANYEGFRHYYRSAHSNSYPPSASGIVAGGIVPGNGSARFNLLADNDSLSTNIGSGDVISLNNNNFHISWHAIHWASQQPHCVWPLVNLAYCLLILLGHSVQKTVFGNLRASEHENVKDQFWNLVFYKVVFVFGVVNVQEVEDAVGWCFFVSVIGFLQLARQLCQERHNYLILMNDWTRRGECRRNRILGLLAFIFVASIFLFISVSGWYFGSAPVKDDIDSLDFKNAYYGYSFGSRLATNANSKASEPVVGSPYDFNLGLHSAIFMLCELGLLVIQTLHALIICIFDQVRTKCYKGRQMSDDTYSSISHSINFKFDLISLLFDLVHHVHMLVCCNLFLSMTSLIVSLQMRNRVRQIHAVLKKRQSYLWLSEHIDQYPDVPNEPGPSKSDEENCAICWDALPSQKAKSLPCHHIFHTSCLRQWLLVSMNCPTCRLTLMNEKEAQYCSLERTPRRVYGPRPIGLWGFLQTGQALLDLFGGWDPQYDDSYDEAPPAPRPVPLFADFGVQDWTVQSQPVVSMRSPHRESTTTTDTQKDK